jgi:hypothetical protein
MDRIVMALLEISRKHFLPDACFKTFKFLLRFNLNICIFDHSDGKMCVIKKELDHFLKYKFEKIIQIFMSKRSDRFRIRIRLGRPWMQIRVRQNDVDP